MKPTITYDRRCKVYVAYDRLHDAAGYGKTRGKAIKDLKYVLHQG